MGAGDGESGGLGGAVGAAEEWGVVGVLGTAAVGGVPLPGQGAGYTGVADELGAVAGWCGRGASRGIV